MDKSDESIQIRFLGVSQISKYVFSYLHISLLALTLPLKFKIDAICLFVSFIHAFILDGRDIDS